MLKYNTVTTVQLETIFPDSPISSGRRPSPTWECFSSLIIELQIKAQPNLVSDSQQMHSTWLLNWRHYIDSANSNICNGDISRR